MKKQTKISFRIKRYWGYVLATIIALVIPFIQIGGNQIFLLSFDKKQLHLMGTVFDMQELYMMPFLLMILFIGIFAITAIGGRAWCGWACPQTIFRVIYRDLIEGKLLGLRRIKNKQKEPDWSKSSNKIKRIIAILIWFVLSVVAASDFMWYFIPPTDFFAYLNDIQNHMILVGFVAGIVVFLVYDIVFLKEDFCIYVCPYSRIQTVLYDDDTFQAIYSEKRGGKIYNGQEKVVLKQQDVPDGYDCTACQSCVTVCPTHIDIRKGMQLECINCLECVDVCTTVMGKLGKESLIQWSSSNEVINNKKVKFFRKKTIMYIIAMLGIVTMLFIMGGKKEYMLLNVNKTTKLYSIKDNGKRVENTFVLLFQNTQRQPYTYDLEVIGEYAGKITIKKFIPFRLSRGKLAKKVVKLVTTQKLVNDNTKDTPVTVTLRAFAKEKPDKINVIRKAVFMYPRVDKLK
jgi:cytochrome c oxidase accessory protein FixG